jgi:uncharacterized protein (TIGR00661 family)
MKIMFAVQGDGRGHMTQAIAASHILEAEGHEIVAVTVGTNPSRKLAEFFTHAFRERVIPIESPGFSFTAGKGVTTAGTVRQAITGLHRYRNSLRILETTLDKTQPDLLINFLEPLVGVFNLLHRHPVPVISVGHQFMLEHPEFVRCPKFALQQWTMRRYVRLTGARSTRFALSFYPASSQPERRLFVGPPLLRQDLFQLQIDARGRFLLAYVLNQGYTEEILKWHAEHPGVELHCFCEKPKIEPVWRYDTTLWFHKLDGKKFLQMMAECRGVASTAGFESLNEAAWLGKPLLVVPVANHIEQYLNALDAQKAGLAMAATHFDLTPLLTAPLPSGYGAYRDWVKRAGPALLSVIGKATHRPVRTFISTATPAAAAPRLSPQQTLRGLLARNSADRSGDTPPPAVSSHVVASRC